MITKSNPTPPIDGKEYELIYKTHRIGPFAHDIYGLLVDYGNTDDSVDNYPVENFTERLSFARDFAQTLVSLLENGVDLNGVTIKDEKYVSPIVAAMKHNLYQCILEMETELRHNEESASSLCNSYDPADDEYAEYHHPIPIPNNAKRLDDWLVSNRRVMDMLPGSVIMEHTMEKFAD